MPETSNSSVSQFLPKTPSTAPLTSSIPKPQSPTIELATVSSLNVSEAIFHNVNNSLYCRRRHKQVIELNPTTLQLNLIETGSESEIGLSPMKFLYTLKNWPANSTPKRILCNDLGTFLAIQGTTGNVSVLKLTLNNSVCEEIEIETSNETCQMVWHPASPADHHLVILSKSGKLSIFDLLQARVDFDAEESADLKFLRLTEAEQVIKLPGNRTDSFVGISFLPTKAELICASWTKLTAFLVKESGDIFALCPFLPLQFRAQRQNHLLPLKKVETEPVCLKWLDEVLLSCEFVASAAGDTDWVLATSPASFNHLQPRLQGPFLIQPEPMEIHHLAAYDRVVDFSVHQRSDQNLTIAIIAFGSGKVDVLAVASEILPKFQLKNSLIKTIDDSDQLPIMALLESIDLGCSSNTSNNRRSVDCKIKILDQDNRYILVSTDSTVLRIDLRMIEEEEDDWSIECNSSVLIEKLKNHVLCVSNDKIYPGSFKLRFSNETEDQNKWTYQTSGILETVTKFAFPLGKMEIEGGAVQLEGLVENLMKNLNRLKSHRTIKSNLKLPEIDEIGATELNEQVSEWQESLVSSAMRVGHEIALRSNELVQILRREREILVRAKTLLTAKPERLQLLMTKLREAKDQNQKLMERTRKTCQELSKYSVYDEILIQKIQEISSNLAGHSLTKPETNMNEFVVLEDESDLLQSQLLMQSEKLMKLKEQLQMKMKN